MATKFFNGTEGSFKIGSTDYNVTSWTFSAEVTELDTTTTADGGDYAMITGRTKRTATAEIMWDDFVTGNSPCPVKQGTTGTLTLGRDASDANPISGTAFIVSVDLDHAFDSVMKANLKVTFSGAVTGFLDDV